MINLEEYEILKNNILSLNSEGAIKTVMVSSSASGEGCSTVVSNLATTMARNKALKVILIDGNLRHSTLHETFELENNAGLSDLILGNAEIKDVLKKTKISNLFIISSGKGNVNPTEIFESNKMKSFIEKMKEQVDYLIFDSPPINAYPEAHILSAQVDGVILVVHAGRTRWEMSQKAKEQLQMAHANILGVVLNRSKHVIPGFLYKRL